MDTRVNTSGFCQTDLAALLTHLECALDYAKNDPQASGENFAGRRQKTFLRARLIEIPLTNDVCPRQAIYWRKGREREHISIATQRFIIAVTRPAAAALKSPIRQRPLTLGEDTEVPVILFRRLQFRTHEQQQQRRSLQQQQRQRQRQCSAVVAGLELDCTIAYVV